MLEEILAQQLSICNGWRIVQVRYRVYDRDVEVVLEPARKAAVCSGCGETKKKAWDVKDPRRPWRHLDAWNVETQVVAPLRRVNCRHCGVRVEAVPWAPPMGRLTRMFENEILHRARDSSIAGVSRQMKVHWTTVMRLIEQAVMEGADKKFRRSLRRIGVDEVSYGKGQSKYLSIVWDHDRGQVVWIGKGREQKTLDAFFEKLGPRRSRHLVCVTMDRAHGYIASVKNNAPQADIVFDRFHIERYLTEAVNEVRKQEFFRKGSGLRELIRGKKFLLLKKRRRLHWRRRSDLDALLRLNRRLCRAYILKEQFDHAWSYHSERGMASFLERWEKMLRWSRLQPLKDFFGTLRRHGAGVLAWAKHHMSNAALEGHNSLVRGISQRGRGYRNPGNLMLMLYHRSWR
jgi:transposase